MATATARLTKEFKELMKNPVDGFKVELTKDGDLFDWTVYITGPEDTPYHKGIFKAHLVFPQDYPLLPPSMKFISEMWHPNIYADGKVCISILHTPDPMNPDEKDETWRPVQTVESILLSVISMLSDPNFSSPANVDASVEMRKNPDQFKQRVIKLVEKARKDLPKDFEMPKPKKPEPSKEEAFDLDYDDFNQDDDMDDEEDMIDDEEGDEEGNDKEEVED